MNTKQSFGEYLRELREKQNLPIRKVASKLDIDPSTLGKIERGERSASSEMLPILADIFKIDVKALKLILFSDKVAYQIIEEEDTSEILRIAEKKIQYLKNKNLIQGSLDLK